ncbi:MAG: preprotein translocase subunit SecG [Clostridia bacterium]|nr:preprotein translocase subunit SecG [Clostridia bacterium]
MNIFLGILLLLAALFLIVAVLLQNGKSKGTGVVTGGAETFFGKTKGKALDKKLSILTTVVAIVFVVLVIIVFVSQDYEDIFGKIDNVTTTGSGTSTGSGDLVVDTATGSDDLAVDTATGSDDLIVDADPQE